MGLLATFASVSARIQGFLSIGLLIAIGLGAIVGCFRFLVGVVDFMRGARLVGPRALLLNAPYVGG